MAAPRQVIWKCKPHTVAKHKLLKRYLEAWYPILAKAQWCRSITYAEGFAGAGIYEDGEPGSPVIAADVFLRRRELLDSKPLNMVLVEENGRRIQRLKEEMAPALTRYGEPPAQLHMSYEEGSCGDKLLPALHGAGAMGAPVFAFLDSWGGPDVPFGLVRSIARQPAGEVLVTFGTNFLTRFGEKDQHQQAGDDAFGGTGWQQVHQLPAHQKKAFLVSAYRQSLLTAGFRYVIPFEMIDDTGSDLYLIYGTRNRKGLEKMKEAMWHVDPVQGVHYRDPRDPNQITLELDFAVPHLEPLQEALMRELAQGDRTLDSLREYALLETVYRPPHARTAVLFLLRQGLAEREPSTGQLTGTSRIKLTPAGKDRLARPTARPRKTPLRAREPRATPPETSGMLF
jgi:three-Cys-motif partner protein